MAANQLPQKSVAAHRASLKRKENKNKTKTLLIVALSPIASRSLVSKLSTASQLTDMPTTLWALLQSQQSHKYCYDLTSAFATKHASFPAVVCTCLIGNRRTSPKHNAYSPCRQSSSSPRTYRHGTCWACARLAWGTSAMASEPTRKSLTCSLITERPGSTWHKPERRSDSTALYMLPHAVTHVCASVCTRNTA